MTQATRADKPLIVDLLTRSFNDNRSVNYIIPQDHRRVQRIRSLMEYSFEVCYRYGMVCLSGDNKACALVLYPDRQKTSLASMLLDVKLVTGAIGLSHLKKALSREAAIKRLRPARLLYYLWFLGVEPTAQQQGIGSALLHELMDDAHAKDRLLCLETSAPQNVPWYQKWGFSVYNKLELDYTLYFMKHDEQ